MDQQTKEIIKLMASIQMDAILPLTKLKSDYSNLDKSDDILRGIQILQVEPWEIKREAKQRYNYYKEVANNPELLLMAPEYQLLICSHILFRMEDEWMINNSQGVYGAWTLIHESMSKFHPEFSLII